MLDRRVPGLSIWDTKRRKWKPDFFESGHDMFERSYTNLSSNRADQMIRVGSRAERLKETTRGWAASFGLLVMDMSDAQAEQLQPPGVGPRRLRHLRSRLRRQRGATIGARLARGRQVTARVAWAAVLTAAALSGCTATGAGETGPVAVPEAGPVSTQTPVFSSLSAKPGSTFTDGLALFSLRGGKPATVTAVRPDPVEGLELLGVRVAGGNRPMAAIQFTRSWPPVDPDLPPPAIGDPPAHTPTPGPGADALELLIGYRVTGEGQLVRKGVWVDYTTGGKDYSAYLPAGLAVCVGSDEGADCAPPKNWQQMY